MKKYWNIFELVNFEPYNFVYLREINLFFFNYLLEDSDAMFPYLPHFVNPISQNQIELGVRVGIACSVHEFTAVDTRATHGIAVRKMSFFVLFLLNIQFNYRGLATRNCT